MNRAPGQRAICVYGAGAIGLDLGVNLLDARHCLTFIARGRTLDALRQQGIVYRTGGQRRLVDPGRYACTADPRTAGPQDYLFLTVKADALLVGEAHEVGLRLGVLERGDFALEDFLSFAEAHLRDHETSMLQDFKKGRALELGRMLEIVITYGELEGVEAPVHHLRSVHREIQEKLAPDSAR